MLPSRLTRQLTRTTLLLCTVLWGAGVAAGSLLLWSHALVPGSSATAPEMWPADTQLPRQTGRATLLMFAHPKCPCTRASLRELERLLVSSGEPFDLVIAFLQPPNTNTAWAQTDLWQAATSLPGAHVVLDRRGAEADRFHATTSGEVLLYGANGRLAFQGGITGARGHEGDSAGREAILALAAGRAAPDRLPTFGCPLRSSPLRQP